MNETTDCRRLTGKFGPAALEPVVAVSSKRIEAVLFARVVTGFSGDREVTH
jgi:hypothetical protein